MLFFQSDTSVLFMIYDMWYDSDMYLYVEADLKGGGALCAGNAVALLVFGPVMP